MGVRRNKKEELSQIINELEMERMCLPERCFRILTLLFLVISTAMCSLYTSTAATITVKEYNPSGEQLYTYLYLYQNGRKIGYYTGRSIEVPDCQGTYYYHTETNHSGVVSAGQSLNLKCGAITFLVKDRTGNPLSTVYIRIYEDGDQVGYKFTDKDGQVTFDLKPSSKYAYQTDFCSGTFELGNSEQILELNKEVKEAITAFPVVMKYHDRPVKNGSYSLYTYPDKEKSLDSASSSSVQNGGVLLFTYPSEGRYWVQDKYGAFSEPFTVDALHEEKTVEHYKVTFISNDDNPNVLKSIQVAQIAQKTFPYDDKISDGKGYAVYYLMPGEYKYSHLGGTGVFTVDEQDMTVNIPSNTRSLEFLSSDGSPCVNLTVSLSSDNNGKTTEYVTDSNGKCEINCLKGLKYYVSINGVGKAELSSNKQQTFQVSKCAFNLPEITGTKYVNVSDGASSLNIFNGETKSLLNGTYQINIYDGSGQTTKTVDLRSDLDFASFLPDSYSFRVTVDNEPYNGYVYFRTPGQNDRVVQSINGNIQIRLENPEEISVAIYPTYTYCQAHITNGCSLDFSSVNIESEGPGIAFPYTSGYTYSYLKGSNLKLVAVAAANEEFDCWEINGVPYSSSAIEYKVDGKTKAMAKFKTFTTRIKEISGNSPSLNIRVTQDTVNFSEPINGDVKIYSVNGVQVKSIFVISDHIDITDLMPGAYVITVDEKDGKIASAKFAKYN